MNPDDFLLMWERLYTSDGKTLPLPPGWRTKVLLLPANREDWAFALRTARDATQRPKNPLLPDAFFNYCVGVIWNRLGDEMEINTGATRPYLSPVATARGDA